MSSLAGRVLSLARGASRGRGDSRLEEKVRATLGEILSQFGEPFAFQGLDYVASNLAGSMNGRLVEEHRSPSEWAKSAIYSSPAVFACLAARQAVFSSARLSWQALAGGRPSGLFGNPDLRIFENPYPGGSTKKLLSRMEMDVFLYGNSYHVRLGNRIVRLQPDWVKIVIQPLEFPGRGPGGSSSLAGWEVAGYVYEHGGQGSGETSVFMPEEVAHYAPHEDPWAQYRGMSWLTPLIREIFADDQMTEYKARHLQNGATPSMVIKQPPEVTPELAKRFKDAFTDVYVGASNAGKPLHVGGGADVTVVGSTLEKLDFRAVQGAGETRIAAVAGIPPVVVGFSEGLSAATYSNYAMARRRWADGSLHPAWEGAATALAPLVRTPAGARLWYDVRDVAFLREDEGDQAQIQWRRAATLRTLVDAGFTAESAIAAIGNDELSQLEHSGLFSVQLQPPGDMSPDLAMDPPDPTEEGNE